MALKEQSFVTPHHTVDKEECRTVWQRCSDT